MSTRRLFLSRTSLLIVALMCAASVGAIVARPAKRIADERPQAPLDETIPRQFGEWKEDTQRGAQVVNPQTQELLDKLYAEVISRVYVNPAGYRIMLSIAYGSDQRGGLQAHKPEVCYPAQGFVVRANMPGKLATPHGEIAVRRLSTALGPRNEPLTYWFTIGGKVVQGTTQKRIVDLAFGVTGRVPDGLLFRVSSVDAEEARAFEMQEAFVNELLRSVTSAALWRLSGLQPS